MKERVKLPIGQTDFCEIRQSGCYYIDKTSAISTLVRDGSSSILYTRPRRIVKTTYQSKHRAFFDIRDDNKDIFSGLDIMNDVDVVDGWMNKYPVIYLTFKDIDGLDFDSAIDMLRMKLSALYKGYSFIDVTEDDEEGQIFHNICSGYCSISEIRRSMEILARILYLHYGKKVIILLDEYDVPLDKAERNGYYPEMLSVMRSMLLSVLKDCPYTAKGILTGCLRISKESLFTGLNNLAVYSVTGDSYADTFGFTEKEVARLLLDAGLEAKADIIREWYDGYLLGKQQEIYCPWSIMNYLDDLQEDVDASPQAYWQNNAENALIKRLFPGSSPEMTQDIADFIAGSCLVKEISINPTFESLDSTPRNLWTLLYMSGYLTRASNEIVEAQGISQNFENNKLPLVIPNREIRDIFKYEVRNWFRESVSEAQQNDFFTAFWNVDAEGVKKELEAILLEKVSSQDLAKDTPGTPRENFYHGLLIGYFLVAYPQTFSNLEAGTGQYDIRVLDDKDTTNKKAAIVEIKRATKEKDDLAQLAEDGLAQIRERKYDVRLLSDPKVTTVLHWSIAFFKKSCEARAVVVRQP